MVFTDDYVNYAKRNRNRKWKSRADKQNGH